MPARRRAFWLAAAALWLLAIHHGAQAADLQACRLMRQERDAVASRAMEQELALVRSYRARICPRLAQQAEGANARDQQFLPINFADWNACRVKAERELEKENPIRYRNSQQFTFYTPTGAAYASQADELQKRWQAQGCQIRKDAGSSKHFNPLGWKALQGQGRPQGQ